MKNRAASLLSVLCVAASLVLSGHAYAMGGKPKTFPIEVKIDFGPAAKPGYSGTLEIEKGTTPKEAVAQIFPVLLGKACCSLREILAIDGVKIDPAKNYWWVCLVNGSKKVSPGKRKLKAGDVLEWRYIEEEQ